MNEREQIIKYANELDTCLLEIADGKLKANKIPLEPICKLIAYARASQPAQEPDAWMSDSDSDKVISKLAKRVRYYNSDFNTALYKIPPSEAQPAQEPVAWKYKTMYWDNRDSIPIRLLEVATPLFTTQPSEAARIAELEAKLAECEKDAKRLDFIDAKFCGLSNSERYLPFRLSWGKGNNKTLRQVVDQAIADKG